jgi:hypothetical protein
MADSSCDEKEAKNLDGEEGLRLIQICSVTPRLKNYNSQFQLIRRKRESLPR